MTRARQLIEQYALQERDLSRDVERIVSRIFPDARVAGKEATLRDPIVVIFQDRPDNRKVWDLRDAWTSYAVDAGYANPDVTNPDRGPDGFEVELTIRGPKPPRTARMSQRDSGRFSKELTGWRR